LALITELTGPADAQVLGRPAAGTVVEVVDQHDRPVPARMVGRLRARPAAGGSWVEPGWQVHQLGDGRLACAVRNLDVSATAAPGPAGADGRHSRESVELRLTELWCEALERDGIGRDEDFFSAGGHSVLGAHLVARIRDELHCDISLLDFLSAPSIAQLVELIEQRSAAEPDLSPELLEQVARLSDEEVRQLLDQLGGS
jgi:acyl carrier protein